MPLIDESKNLPNAGSIDDEDEGGFEAASGSLEGFSEDVCGGANDDHAPEELDAVSGDGSTFSMHGVPEDVTKLIARGAIFVVNNSGGKDSQAMLHFVLRHVPAAQVRVVHAVLPGVEWDGVVEHVRDMTPAGIPVHECRSRRTLIEMIEERGMFPSPSQRQCTSDLKRGPIERTIRRMAKAEGFNLIVNCMGMRAQESPKRAKLTTFKLSAGNSKAGREWYDWLPIHNWKIEEVFAQVAAVGQKVHWAYAAGMSRLSCVLCIMSSKKDLTTAAKLNPVMYAQYVYLERSTGQVMLMPSKKGGRLNLEQVTGVPVDEALVAGFAERAAHRVIPIRAIKPVALNAQAELALVD